MAKLRAFKASATGTVGSDPKLRLHAASATGTVVVKPRLRVFKASATGTQAAIITPVAARVVEPMQAISTTVTLVSGSPAADSYTWRQVSGPTVTLTGTGATRSFQSPSLMPTQPALVVLGVLATSGGSNGPEVLINVTTLPQTRWSWSGSDWVGGGHVDL